MGKSKRSQYSHDFKLKVVQEVLNGKYTKEEARKLYGIKSNCAILYWIRQFSGQSDYRQGGISAISTADMLINKEEQDKDQRIKELEDQLRREKTRGDLWEKLVDIAEEQLNVDIRKKSGAKQSLPSKKKRANK